MTKIGTVLDIINHYKGVREDANETDRPKSIHTAGTDSGRQREANGEVEKSVRDE